MAWPLARLLLVCCTVLGIAALHTIGHRTAAGGDQYDGRTVASNAAPSTVSNLVPGTPRDDDTCGGDGCTHQIATPDSDRDATAWWQVCLAILSVLILTVLADHILRAVTTARAAPMAGRRRPPAAAVTAPPIGLTLVGAAVLRT